VSDEVVPAPGPNPPGPIDPRELRVSDAEREHVIGVLQKAIGQGLITLDEFTARTDTALAAKTRGELNAVLVDLPGVVHQEPGRPRHQHSAELRNTMSAMKRTGRWVVPHELVVRNRMGSMDLDFTDAVIDQPEVHIELDVSGGAVKLLLPENATITTDDVELTASSVKDKVGAGDRIGRPHFVVSGSMKAGSLKVRRPTYIRIGALVIRFPWKVAWDRD
jgi:hypothetical protein